MFNFLAHMAFARYILYFEDKMIILCRRLWGEGKRTCQARPRGWGFLPHEEPLWERRVV